MCNLKRVVVNIRGTTSVEFLPLFASKLLISSKLLLWNASPPPLLACHRQGKVERKRPRAELQTKQIKRDLLKWESWKFQKRKTSEENVPLWFPGLLVGESQKQWSEERKSRPVDEMSLYQWSRAWILLELHLSPPKNSAEGLRVDNPRVKSVMNPDWHYCRRALPACQRHLQCLLAAVFMAASRMPVLKCTLLFETWCETLPLICCSLSPHSLCHLQLSESVLWVPGGRECHHGGDSREAHSVSIQLFPHMSPAPLNGHDTVYWHVPQGPWVCHFSPPQLHKEMPHLFLPLAIFICAWCHSVSDSVFD